MSDFFKPLTNTHSITGYLSAGFFDPKGPPDYAAQAAMNERRRQALITQGISNVNAVYNGGTALSYQGATGKYDPSQQYYTFGNKGYTLYKPHPLMKNGATPGLDAMIGKGKLFTQQNQTYAGFQPDFYQQRAQDYVNYALPQLGQQYNENQKAMEYGLANRGLLNSSTADLSQSRLAKEAELGQQNVYDTATQQALDLQKQVAASKNAAISTVYQTADPGQGQQNALNSYFQLQQPSIYGPIANAFSGIASNYYLRSLYNSQAPPQYAGYGGFGQTSPSYGALPSQPSY